MSKRTTMFSPRLTSLQRKMTSPRVAPLCQLNESHGPRQITSRQSMTPSSLSMATSVTESEAQSEFDQLFPRRWEDESEMDKSLKILKQKHAATMRVRKMHDVHNRLLEGKIRLLRTSYSHDLKELTKETRSLQDEINDFEQSPKLRFPRIESATPIESRSSSGFSGRSQYGRSISSRDQICQTCLFDPENTTLRCRHFPCCLPKTYNSIGYMPKQKPQTYSCVSNYKQLLQRCRDLRPPTSKTQESDPEEIQDDIDSESRAPRTTIKEKIRGLKQLVKEMKERNEKTKPRDWAINYGDPLPRRVILKPVKTAS